MVDYSEGKESEFNWAALFVRSLAEEVDKISELNLCPEYYNEDVKKYNYELAAVKVINLFIRLWGHLTSPEQQNGRLLKTQLETAIARLPLIDVSYEPTMSGSKYKKVFNTKNLNIIKEIIFEFQIEITGWIETHHLGTPAKKDPTKAAIDM